jgi:hypothetical protein
MDMSSKREIKQWMKRLEKEIKKDVPATLPLDDTGRSLRTETEKWLARLEKESEGLTPTEGHDNEKVRNSITNVHAYVKDGRHFLQKGDMLRAFEAVVYAWGILETCQRLGVISGKDARRGE